MKQKIEIEVPEGYKAVFNPDTKNVEIVKVDTKPKTWEEFCENNPIKSEEHYITRNSVVLNCANVKVRNDAIDKNVCTSEEANAFLALMQLRQLRKAWVGDWEPDWHEGTIKNCIFIKDNKVTGGWLQRISSPLSFPTKEMAKEFIECFKDLIEKAKILL